MQLTIENSNILPEYLKLKYDIPNNIYLIFSFYSNYFFNGNLNLAIRLEEKDVPIEWKEGVEKALIYLNDPEIDDPTYIVDIPSFGSMIFWE